MYDTVIQKRNKYYFGFYAKIFFFIRKIGELFGP